MDTEPTLTQRPRQRISFFDDLQKIGEIPCARSSLLSGIASGAGVGAIRGLSAGVFVASNWAVGTFMAVTLGSWYVSFLVPSTLALRVWMRLTRAGAKDNLPEVER